jgi:excisionase family DNA binding protein
MSRTAGFHGLEAAATFAAVSERSVRRAVRSGRLRAYRIGRRLVFDPADLERWVRSTPATPGAVVVAERLRLSPAAKAMLDGLFPHPSCTRARKTVISHA